MNVIESLENSKVKDACALQQKKFRRETGCFLAEGVKLVETALQSGVQVERLFFCRQLSAWERAAQLVATAESMAVQCYEVSERVMRKISTEDNPQAICAVCRIPEYNMKEIIGRAQGCIIVLDALQDPGNVGTIIRSADAAGCLGVLACSGTVDIFNPKTVRAAMGSSFHLPCVEMHDTAQAIALLKDAGYIVVYTAADGEYPVHEYDFPAKLAIIIGNEGNGVSEQAAALCDQSLAIPIWGKAESLNASIAASIVIYQYAFKHLH